MYDYEQGRFEAEKNRAKRSISSTSAATASKNNKRGASAASKSNKKDKVFGGARSRSAPKGGRKLFMVQVPCVLPDLPEGYPAHMYGADMQNDVPDQQSIHTYPQGKIGKLRVHASGKMTMKIGGTVFDVGSSDVPFKQEAMLHQADSATAMFIGDLRHSLHLHPQLFTRSDRQAGVGRVKGQGIDRHGQRQGVVKMEVDN